MLIPLIGYKFNLFISKYYKILQTNKKQKFHKIEDMKPLQFSMNKLKSVKYKIKENPGQNQSLSAMLIHKTVNGRRKGIYFENLAREVP